MNIIRNREFQMDENTVVVFGKLDGIHKGHRKLFSRALEIGQQNNLKVVAFLFKVCDGCRFSYMDNEQITTFEERELFLKSIGVDVVVEYPFDENIAGMEPLEFLEKIVKNTLHASYVVIGTDWTFGKNREGNCEVLKAAQKLYGFEAVILDKELYQNREISSTWVREEINQGNMENVNILLGYPYSVHGKVCRGAALGRTIGFPTLNIRPDEKKILPPFGVYSSKVILNNKDYFGVTNIGIKPTVSETEEVFVETYVFDFDEDAYGEEIEVQIYHFQRPEMKFSDVDKLKSQIELDRLFAKSYFMI